MVSRKYLLIASIALFAGVLCSCKKQRESDESVLTVSVSIEPQRWLLEQIGGDRIKAVSFMPGEANPENFDPPMSALKTASESAIYMQIGRLPWEADLIKKITASNPELKVIDTSEGISPLYGTHGHSHAHSHGEEIDPHIWTSVKNASIMASNMYKALKEYDSGHADYYTERFNRLSNRLDSIDRAFNQRLEPFAGQSFLVWHPSLSYFARDYGLKQIAIGMENKETTPIGMKRQIENAMATEPIVFFVQPQMDGNSSESILKQLNTKKRLINPQAYDLLSELEQITDALTSSE